MRRLLAFLAVIALMLAACGPGTSDTTSADTLPEDSDTTSSEAAGTTSDEFSQVCIEGSPGYPAEGVCANVSAEESSQEVDIELPIGLSGDPNRDDRLDHMCIVVPDHVFVFPDVDFSPEDANVTEVTEDALEGLGVLDPASMIEFLNSTPLGLFQTAQGADLIEIIDEIESQGVMASPHYLLTPVDPKWKFGPSSIAKPIGGDWSQLSSTGTTSDSDARVVIVDTGAVGDVSTIRANADPGKSYSAEAEGTINSHVRGHGLFAASIVRQFDRSLTIDVYRASDSDGILSEVSILDALSRAGVSEDDVVNLSLGTYPCRASDPALGLIQGLSDMATDGTQIVAASGNDGSGHPPMFPAALGFTNDWTSGISQQDQNLFVGSGVDLNALQASITAVGAMDSAGNEASFSNESELLAPGVDVIGWYFDPSSPAVWNGETSGLAIWSGTSFAAPHFAACLASGACTPP